MSVIVAIRLLETGPPGVGILNGALGAGALLGSCLALLVVRPGRLAMWLGIGVALLGPAGRRDRRSRSSPRIDS
jgi:hypothetical protein